jgi:hypothetical protein
MSAIGIVACETLYPDVERIRPDAEVRYVPQEYHEFPVSVPRDGEITARVQTAVDALDEPGRERIAVVYANNSDGLHGLESVYAPLAVSRFDDCVSVLLGGEENPSTGERKAFGTYYLTRGWVDCGVDSYKLYRAYLGEEADLLARFRQARDGRRVTWPDGDRYQRAVARGQSMSAGTVGRFFYEVVQYFDRVELVDTGHLEPFDHEYAESFRSFVESVRAEHGGGGSVTLSVTDGTTAPLETLLGGDLPDEEFLDVYQPGVPVS